MSSFNTSKVIDMNMMFTDCLSLTKITFGDNYNTSNVENMYAMFAVCRNLTKLDLSSFITLNVTTRERMFMGCTNMQEILVGEGWTEPTDTEKISMFDSCGVQDVTKKPNSST